MVELREQAGLEQEAGAHPGVQPVAADGLQGDLALELLVEADVDGSHAAFGQVALDADVTDLVAREGSWLKLVGDLPKLLPDRLQGRRAGGEVSVAGERLELGAAPGQLHSSQDAGAAPRE